MLIEAAMSVVRSVLVYLWRLLPDSSLWDLIDEETVIGWGEWLGESLGPFDAVFPVHELAGVVHVVFAVVLPVELAFGLGRFIFRYVPWLGK